MKTILSTILFSLALPVAASAAFEKHFGEYSVISSPNGGANQACPLMDASISRKIVDGIQTIVIEASGKRSGDRGVECSVEYTSGLSFQGLSGITCAEGDDQIRCTNGRDVYEVKATISATGILSIHSVQTGAYPGTSDWVLRKK